MIDKDKPIYPVGVAAKMLEISSDRLRTYEESGLIKPHRAEITSEKLKGAKRLYSQNDVEWIAKLRDLIKGGISIPALEIIIQLLPYWEESKHKEIQALIGNDNWKLLQELIDSPVYKSLTSDNK